VASTSPLENSNSQVGISALPHLTPHFSSLPLSSSPQQQNLNPEVDHSAKVMSAEPHYFTAHFFGEFYQEYLVNEIDVVILDILYLRVIIVTLILGSEKNSEQRCRIGRRHFQDLFQLLLAEVPISLPTLGAAAGQDDV